MRISRRSLLEAIGAAALVTVVATGLLWLLIDALGTPSAGARRGHGVGAGVVLYFIVCFPIAFLSLSVCAPLYLRLRAAGRATVPAISTLGALSGVLTMVLFWSVLMRARPEASWLVRCALVGALGGAIAGLTLTLVHGDRADRRDER